MIHIELIAADTQELAQDLTFNDVRTSAAVAGIPPANHEAIFAIHRPRISFDSWNLVLVILSAILAEITVSNIATIEIVNAATPISVYTGILLVKLWNNDDHPTASHRRKAKSGKLSDNVRICKGIIPCFIKYHTAIPRILTGIIPGTFGRYFFINCSKTNATANNPSAARLLSQK